MKLFIENLEKTPMKDGFGKALSDMGNDLNHLVCIGTDITSSVGLNYFKDKFPDRFFSLGIAEQNAASVCAGLSLSDKLPVFSTYAVFSSMRSIDQIRVSICYNNLHVIIGGAHAGISVGPDGATHQALEDIAVMRTLPNMCVLSPCDENQTYLATLAALTKLSSPCYIRYGREPVTNFTSLNSNFTIGKADVLKTGSELSIFATGSMVWTALCVADLLEDDSISAEVVNVHTIKPLDRETLIKSAKKTTKVLCLEEHQISSGLGGAVAEVLSEECPTKMKILGIPDTFGESGKPDELLKKYNLDANGVYLQALDFVKKSPL